MSLTAAEFADFYRQVHGNSPFHWQADLVRQVLAERAWPELIDVPTGLGKTALLDIAVFVAAATSGDVGAERLGRRRIFFVVDRRIVVDEAYDRAVLLSQALERSLAAGEDTVARAVATGLRAFAPEADRALTIAPPGVHEWEGARRTVLPVTRMRGGVTWEASWLDRPDLPGVVVGTVDQVGSRLLFRGYGVTDRRKPIDAALVGTDSLILVDEAHLAEVMVTTVTEAHRRDTQDVGVPRAKVVRMTATSGSTELEKYSLDVGAHRDDDVAWRRLTASKRLSMMGSDVKTIVQTLADKACDLLTPEHDTVLVVCNTVDRARQVHAHLIKAVGRKNRPLDADVSLLIGRSRPADRELLVRRIKERFGVGRARAIGTQPAILVATQTVEVGANLDVDGLVSESAPWDCLVQRMGRLNRLGECAGTARALVVHDGVEDGPVYGARRDATWQWLEEIVAENGGELDVSPLACRDLAVPDEAAAERPTAPLVLSPVLDCWVRTGPVPVPDTPVAPYLHGLGSNFASASIVWRDGLLEDDPTGDDAEWPDEEIHADLTALPVRAEELVEVPLHAVRRWLRGESAAAVTDLDQDVDPSERVKKIRDDFRALAWRSAPTTDSSGTWVWIEAEGIRPGDVLVVPSERGGLDQYGWAPDSEVPVLDVADVVRSRASALAPNGSLHTRSKPVLRLDNGTARRIGALPEAANELRRLVRELRRDPEEREGPSLDREINQCLASSIDEVLESVGEAPRDERLPGSAWTPELLTVLKSWLSGEVSVVPILDGRQQPSGRFVLAPSNGLAGGVERDDEFPEGSSVGTHQVTLKAHHQNVGDRARDIAKALGLPAELERALVAAARWHDLGKVESRFQAMLCGGDEYEAMLVDEPLAKSGMNPVNRGAYRIARQRSGLPPMARHEAWSAALVGEYLNAAAVGTFDFDPDLVVHLVASHHGHARPWLPAVVDDKPRDVAVIVSKEGTDAEGDRVSVSSATTIDFEHPARFARLNAKYGRWGLALLESVVRSADMTVSGEGS